MVAKIGGQAMPDNGFGTKANSRSTVHRPGYSDYVGVKRYNAAGEVVLCVPDQAVALGSRLL